MKECKVTDKNIFFAKLRLVDIVFRTAYIFTKICARPQSKIVLHFKEETSRLFGNQ